MKKNHIGTLVFVALLTLGLPASVFGELIISYSSGSLSFDPFHTYTSTEAQIYTGIFEGLVGYHPFTLEPVPAIAESWEVSSDGRVYRFKLRPEARFKDGSRITAADFRETWIDLLSYEEKAEYSFLFDIIEGAFDYRTDASENADKIGIRAVSDGLLEVRLSKPAAHFLKILCHHSFVPLHPTDREARKGDGRHRDFPIGSGPFYVAEYSGSELVLLKNPNYWDRENVKLPGLTILFTDDTEEVTARFNSGEIQWAAGGIYFDEIENQDHMVVNPLFATNYFFFRSSAPPWSDPAVRKAMSLLLPWDMIRNENFMYIPTSVLVPRIPGYPSVEGIEAQDTVRAMRILSDAGYPGGRGLANVLIRIPNSMESRRVAEIMKSAWETSLDITVRIETYDYSRYYAMLQDPDYTLGTITWIGDFPDPLTFLQMWTSESNLNDAGYRAESFDRLVDDAMRKTGDDRYIALGRAETMLLQEGVVLPISHSPAFNAVNIDAIGGWFPNALDIHPFKYFRFTVPRPIPGVMFAGEPDPGL